MALPRLALALVVALGLSACGSSASVARLRCDTPCQSTHDPFLLRLLVDLDDPQGVLQGGKLVVEVDGADAASYPIDNLVRPQGSTSPTLAFPLPLRFSTVSDGQEFTVRVHGQNGAEQTNDEALVMRVSL